MIISVVLALSGVIDTMTPPAFAAQSGTAKPSPTKKIVIHKRTQYFIDIEAPVDQVWVGCDRPTSESKSGMLFFVFGGDIAYEFFYRRVDGISMCREDERKYRQMMRGAKTVRLVGTHPGEEPFDPQSSINEFIPSRFTTVVKMITPVFIRMQVGSRCQAYFSEDCQLPQNYWADAIPEPVSEAAPKRANAK